MPLCRDLGKFLQIQYWIISSQVGVMATKFETRDFREIGLLRGGLISRKEIGEVRAVVIQVAAG